MQQRDISRKAIRLLTAMLVDMAGRDDFRDRWEEGDTDIFRYHVVRDKLIPTDKKDAAIMMLSEPDFLLRFCRDRGQGQAYIVELETYHDRIIRHAWARARLEEVATMMPSTITVET